MTIVAQVGNYGESFQRNLGPLGVDRGYNRLWHDGGLMFATADVIVGIIYHTSLPRPENLRLFHVPGAGYDAVDLAALPVSAVVCNCFGHEQAIAEYVMAALLAPNVPLRDADRRLRLGDWAYWAGASNRVHGELAGSTVGLLGFGHIGKAVAARAKAFEMRVHVANRSAVPETGPVDRAKTKTFLRRPMASREALERSEDRLSRKGHLPHRPPVIPGLRHLLSRPRLTHSACRL